MRSLSRTTRHLFMLGSPGGSITGNDLDHEARCAGRVRHHQARGRIKGIRGHVLGERPGWASPAWPAKGGAARPVACPARSACRPRIRSRWQAPPGRPPLPPGHQQGQPAAGQRAAASGVREAPADARRPHGTACRRSAGLTWRATVPHVAVFLSAPLSRSRTSRLGRPCPRGTVHDRRQLSTTGRTRK